jgi:hypothetical protein
MEVHGSYQGLTLAHSADRWTGFFFFFVFEFVELRLEYSSVTFGNFSKQVYSHVNVTLNLARLF